MRFFGKLLAHAIVVLPTVLGDNTARDNLGTVSEVTDFFEGFLCLSNREHCGFLDFGFVVRSGEAADCVEECVYANIDFSRECGGCEEVGNGAAGPPPPPVEPYRVTLNFLPPFQATYRDTFRKVATRWSKIITTDVPNIRTDTLVSNYPRCQLPGYIDDIYLCIGQNLVTASDGPGQIVGVVQPEYVRRDTGQVLSAMLSIDSTDVERMQNIGLLEPVAMQALGHALGVGTLWERQGIVTGINTNTCRYTGPAAQMQYRQLSGCGPPRSVPLDRTGSRATRCAHWRESCLGNELMTSFINPGFNALSILTIGALEDLGYTVDYSAADAYYMPDCTCNQEKTKTVWDMEDGTMLLSRNGPDENGNVTKTGIYPQMKISDKGMAYAVKAGEDILDNTERPSDLPEDVAYVGRRVVAVWYQEKDGSTHVVVVRKQ